MGSDTRKKRLKIPGEKTEIIHNKSVIVLEQKLRFHKLIGKKTKPHESIFLSLKMLQKYPTVSTFL